MHAAVKSGGLARAKSSLSYYNFTSLLKRVLPSGVSALLKEIGSLAAKKNFA